MRGEILSESVVSRPSGDPYLTISQIPTISPNWSHPPDRSPRPYRSGLVVRPPAWNPRGARFDSWCVFKSRCFWGGAKAFSAAKIRPFPKVNKGTLDFYIFLTIFDDFL